MTKDIKSSLLKIKKSTIWQWGPNNKLNSKRKRDYSDLTGSQLSSFRHFSTTVWSHSFWVEQNWLIKTTLYSWSIFILHECTTANCLELKLLQYVEHMMCPAITTRDTVSDAL